MIPTTAKKETLPITSLNKGDSGTVLSTAVSLSVQNSDILTKYKQYLQSCYNARALAQADKYLPTLDAPYINLAMIRRGQPYNPEQRDEFTRKTLHGGVDQILKSKTPINIEDLLTPEDSGRPVRFILVEGPPGIGKSTFAWEACRRWDEIESLRQYHTVVLLKLREKWVLNATQPSDLFRFPPKPELSTNIAEALNKSHGHNLLLVLDGFDEVSHSFHENSVVKSILCRQLLPECTIILTTRPVAKHILKSICQPRVDKHVEIIGFTEEERVRYITEVFFKEPELQVNFLKYMFHVPHIKSMMYIPLNCAIIAQVYYES
ncbi:NACHT, LRR and PYD domains-containing protein 12, partial [Geodia barretti]